LNLIGFLGYSHVFEMIKKRKTSATPSGEDSEEQLCLVFIPALVTVLLHSEKTLGRPLTETEVTAIRDNAVCMTMGVSHAAALEEKRGYSDIVAEAVWPEWQIARLQLGQV
jgi:hypothetical protein